MKTELLCLHDAATMWARFRGWTAWSRSDERYAVWLRPCRAVHTWGLEQCLDICFLNRQDRPLRLLRAVPPRKIHLCRHAYSVLEAPAGCLPGPDGFGPWWEALQRLRHGARQAWVESA